MFKRVLSIIMAVLLLGATAAISVSAAEGTYYDPKPYVPSDTAKAVGFNRYFFLMPDDWSNEYTSSAGIYWWDGADPCGSLAAAEQGVKWPGYKIYRYADTEANVWYCDVPKDVTTIIFNNAFDGGDKSWDNYNPDRDILAYQTVDIGSEYYDEGESENYPSGTESFNNMIYIVDPEKTSESVTGKKTFAGEWYFYHGDGMFDTELEPTYGGVDGDEPHESGVTYEVIAKAKAGEYNASGLMYRFPSESQALVGYNFYGLPEGEFEFTVKDSLGNTYGPVTDSYVGEGVGKAVVTLDQQSGELKVNIDKDIKPTAPPQPVTNTAPTPAQGATSKVSSADTAATTVGNGTVATGTPSMAAILLVVVASVAGVAVVLRKRKLDK